MGNHDGDEKGSSELCVVLNKLSLSSEKPPSRGTTVSDLETRMGSDRKRDPPSYMHVDDEVSTAADDTGGRPGSIYKRHRFHYKKAFRIGDKFAPFHFMNLPSEIRNLIYAKTLARDDGTLFIGTKHSTRLSRSRAVLGNKLSPFTPISDDPDQHAASTRNPAILRTSKTVHAEAGAILYGQKLIFTDLAALQAFLAGLRQPQVALLRHVAIAYDDFNQHADQRAFMPGVFALLAGADGLETLRVPDICRIRAAPFSCTDGLHHADRTISIARWDGVVARNMAAEVYCRLYTYLREAVVIRGIDEVMGVLDVFERVFRDGHDCMKIPFRPGHVVGAEWTEERKVAMKKAMGEEIERLIEEDNN